MRTLECSERSIQNSPSTVKLAIPSQIHFSFWDEAALLFCLLLDHPQLVDNLPGMGRNSTKEPAENPE
jgi:hypothetical protein